MVVGNVTIDVSLIQVAHSIQITRKDNHPSYLKGIWVGTACMYDPFMTEINLQRIRDLVVQNMCGITVLLLTLPLTETMLRPMCTFVCYW